MAGLQEDDQSFDDVMRAAQAALRGDDHDASAAAVSTAAGAGRTSRTAGGAGAAAGGAAGRSAATSASSLMRSAYAAAGRGAASDSMDLSGDLDQLAGYAGTDASLEDVLERALGPGGGGGGGGGVSGSKGAAASSGASSYGGSAYGGVAKSGDVAPLVLALQSAWIHEKVAPELLNFKTDVVAALGAQVAAQTAAVERRAKQQSPHKLALYQASVSAGRESAVASLLPDEGVRLRQNLHKIIYHTRSRHATFYLLMQMDIERVRYLLTSYLRVRLGKVGSSWRARLRPQAALHSSVDTLQHASTFIHKCCHLASDFPPL